MSFVDDKELREYRNIMTAPPATEFADGFTWKTVVGALFLGFFVNPATDYLGLVIGQDGGISGAMRWVMIILFAEIAKRSFTNLKSQELYTLHFMTGAALADPFAGFLWKQFVAQSDYVQGLGLAAELPGWAFPNAAAIQAAGRTLLTKAWLPVMALSMFGLLVSRINNYGLGYVLYRVTSDVEKLPFPFAPVGAAGIMALSTEGGEESKWRWRCFSIGAMIGVLWGLVYVCVPLITEAILPKRVELIPMIFLDFTSQAGKAMPAVPFNLTINLGAFLSGMVVPFWGVMGGLAGLIFTWIANPALQHFGILSTWRPEMGFIDTSFSNQIDFYLAFGIGLTLAVTASQLVIFLTTTVRNALMPKAREITNRPSFGQRTRETWRILLTNNKARGDFSVFIAIAIYVLSTASWIILGVSLIGTAYPWKMMVFYAVVYTPMISYATAKLEGVCGQAVNIPYLRELTIMMTGYKGADIWFAPMPIQNLGSETVGFRILELTGTKIISQVKTLLLTIPIVLIASLMASEMIWRMAPVPSSAYPYTEMMWELSLRQWALMITATMEGGSQFLEAMHLDYTLWGFFSGSGLFALLSALGMPIMLIFGAVWGLAQSNPGAMFCTVAGALVARFHFKPKYKDMWLKYMVTITAGFGCGMGITSMIAMSFNVIVRMLSPTKW
ncbi:MAG: peptide transporter [Planctomycetes bacterium]|nr:peptide transporter [Planctomycetota bacterium]